MSARAVATALVTTLAAQPALAAGGGIEIVPEAGKLVPLIVLFCLMVVPVNRLIIRPLLAVLDEREERIAGARARAAEVGARADEVLSSYEERVAAARAEAETERRATLDEARAAQAERVAGERGEAESHIEQARREVGEALAQARGGLQAQAEELARQAAERMLGRTLQ